MNSEKQAKVELCCIQYDFLEFGKIRFYRFCLYSTEILSIELVESKVESVESKIESAESVESKIESIESNLTEFYRTLPNSTSA